MCNCNKQVVFNQTNTFSNKPNTIDNCSTSLSFLNGLLNLIALNISNNISEEDRYLLQIYKGQVLSAVSLTNYCYTDFQAVETSIYNVISKYS